MGNVQMLLRQHVGAPCAPCVEVGAEVKKGTLIATPTGLGANIFSSVYGKVTEITDCLLYTSDAAGESSRNRRNGRSRIPDRSKT